jgi:hypothetical protein
MYNLSHFQEVKVTCKEYMPNLLLIYAQDFNVFVKPELTSRDPENPRLNCLYHYTVLGLQSNLQRFVDKLKPIHASWLRVS